MSLLSRKLLTKLLQSVNIVGPSKCSCTNRKSSSNSSFSAFSTSVTPLRANRYSSFPYKNISIESFQYRCSHIIGFSRHFASQGSYYDDICDERYINGEFGNYHLVFPRNVSAQREVPDHIMKPEYYETGQPEFIKSSQPIILKTETEIQKLRNACKLARYILNSVLAKAKIGVTTDQLDSYAHELILEHNAYPSPLNYRGFPKSICTSVNNVACHGIPDERALADGDIINVDVTIYLNGFHGDCSETVCVGNVDSQGKELIEITQECLYKGISVCGPNVPFRNIGKAIETLALEKGLTVVPAFTGHGIGPWFHCAPDIYHIDFEYEGTMKPGMAFTIEPILAQGSEFIDILEDGWTAVTSDKSRSAQFEHTILITESGVEILTIDLKMGTQNSSLRQ